MRGYTRPGSYSHTLDGNYLTAKRREGEGEGKRERGELKMIIRMQKSTIN